MKSWPLWLLQLKSVKSDFHSMCLSPQKTFLSHCSVLLLHTFYSVATSLKKSKEVEYRGGNSPPDLKGYFSSSSSSTWVITRYHQVSLRKTSATSSLVCCCWHIPELDETVKWEITRVFNRGLSSFWPTTRQNEDMTVNGRGFAGLCHKEQARVKYSVVYPGFPLPLVWAKPE